MFVHLSAGADMTNPRPDPLPDEKFLTAFCREHQLPCLPTRPAFLAAVNQGTPILIRDHWNVTEHRIAAHAIADFLLQNKLIGDRR